MYSMEAYSKQLKQTVKLLLCFKTTMEGNLIAVYQFITMISNYIQNTPITALQFKMSIITYFTIIVQDMCQFLQIQMDNTLYIT